MLNSPKPETIKKMRNLLGFTQAEAAKHVYVTTRAWQLWEAGQRHMPPAMWELACIKAGLHPDYQGTKKTG